MTANSHPQEPLFTSTAKRNVVLCLCLAALTLALYNGIAKNGFVNYDDDVYITQNRQIQSTFTWKTVAWAFTTYDAANWHPLTWLVHAFDYKVFGLNPIGYHYINVLFHALNAVLLFLILMDATRRTWPSFVLAAIFAVHPLNVESVAWAAETKTVLSMAFLLFALWAYQQYARNPGIVRYALVFVTFACGLMAKPQIITFPFMLLLWDFWPLQRLSLDRTNPAVESHGIASFKRLVLEKVPLFALSAASAFITLKAQAHGGAVRSALEYPLGIRLENAISAYFGYIEKFVWPARLSALYPHPGDSLTRWQIAAAATIVVAITIFVVILRKKKYLPTCWFLFLGTMVPMLGLVQVGHQAMADRYMYLPMIGLLAMVVWGIADWSSSARNRTVAVACACVLAMSAFCALTYRQIGYWRDSETLWSHAVAVTHDNFIAHVNLGETLMEQGHTEEAATNFLEATRIRPFDPAAHLNLSGCERRRHNFAAAMAEDQMVLRLTNDTGLRAYALVNLGTDYRHLGDYDRAKASYQAAIATKPDASRAFIGLGLVAQHNGSVDEAARSFNRAAELEPSDIAYLLLAQALQRQGQSDASEAAAEQARLISSDFNQAQASVNDLLAQ